MLLIEWTLDEQFVAEIFWAWNILRACSNKGSNIVILAWWLDVVTDFIFYYIT